MAFTVPPVPTSTGGNYEPVPADNHVGVCIGVIDLGTHQESFQGGPPKPVRKVKLQFELPDVLKQDGTTFVISKVFNVSLHERATLRKVLDGWLGPEWSDKHRGESWEFLLETPALVNVEQAPAKDDPNRTISYIAGLSKLPKKFAVPQGQRDTFYLDLDSKRLPPELSRFDAELIRKSAEYQAGGFIDEAPKPDGQGQQGNGGGFQRPASNYPPTTKPPGPAITGLPQSGRDLVGWLRAKEQEAPGITDYIQGWGSTQYFPPGIPQWKPDQVSMAVAEAKSWMDTDPDPPFDETA